MSGGGGAAVRRKMDIGSANFRCFLILNFAILGAEEDYPMEAKKKVVVALGHSALGVTTSRHPVHWLIWWRPAIS